MKILLNQPHTPWACMFADAFNDAEVNVTQWNPVLRTLPQNVSVVSGDRISDERYDVFVNDSTACDLKNVKSTRRISVVHIEKNLSDSNSRSEIERVYSENDFVVSVSSHKRATLREFAWSHKTRVIRFVAEDNPQLPLDTQIIGCVQNGMCSEKMSVWDAVSSNRDCVAIGHANRVSKSDVKTPNGTDEYLSALKTLSIFVNVVSGDSFGMASVEAMSFGIPMVTGLSRDIPDEFISGWNCLMTDDRGHRSALQIADFAIELRNNESLRKSIGSAGRDTVRRIFSKEKFRSSFEEIIG